MKLSSVGYCLCVLAFLLFLSIADSTSETSGLKGSLGIYIYENVEGYHTVSSTAGTELMNILLPAFTKIMVHDRIPLESNETVRILEKMTEDRKVTLTTINTWLAGGAISIPTITFADDDIKFKDLTWHIDQDAVITDVEMKGMTHVLFGSISGFVKSVEGKDAKKRLVSVNAIANIRLVDISEGTTVWAKTYRDVKAGFDARTAFDDAVVDLSARVGDEIQKFLTNAN